MVAITVIPDVRGFRPAFRGDCVADKFSADDFEKEKYRWAQQQDIWRRMNCG